MVRVPYGSTFNTSLPPVIIRGVEYLTYFYVFCVDTYTDRWMDG